MHEVRARDGRGTEKVETSVQRCDGNIKCLSLKSKKLVIRT